VNIEGRVCDKCGKEVVISHDNSTSVPSFYGQSALCAECTEKGWWHCDICNNPYNFKTVNTEDFMYLFKPIENNLSYRPKHYFCSNECFNINQIDRDLGYYNLMLFELNVLELQPNLSEEEKVKRSSEIQEMINKLSELKYKLKK
jgi:hypothetical protein